MLDKARMRNKRNREARKTKWATEPQTQGLLQEIENFKEKQRKRWREYYSRKKNKDKPSTRRTSRASLQSDATPQPPSKRPRDMDPDERRAYNAKLQRLSRQRETPKKTWWRRKKDRENKKMKRAEKRQQPSARSLQSRQVS